MAENLPNPGRLVTNSVKRVFKVKMDELLSDLGRPIVLNLHPTVSDCPNCTFNSVLGKSNNIYDPLNPNPLNGPLNKVFLDGQRCPVCNGQGTLNIPRTITYTATISKRFTEREILEAKIRKVTPSTIKTTTVIDSFNDINNCDSALIDGLLYRLAGEVSKTGLQQLIRVKAFWDRAE